ncbi:MAG: hypothetical protein HY744_18110 [Deltaproteobacteria bacterium]|nr:hypothetical protein [Deltaproteobacteria bacterium]
MRSEARRRALAALAAATAVLAPGAPVRAQEPGGAGATDADCRRAAPCAQEGRCSAGAGRCVARSQVDCRLAARCREEGLCFALRGSCQAFAGPDCRQSLACAKHGRCWATDGVCVARIGTPPAAPAAPPAPGASAPAPVAELRELPERAEPGGGSKGSGRGLGAIIAGASMLGTAWLASLPLAFGDDTGWMAVPVVGPWVTLADSGNYLSRDSLVFAVLVLDGLVQGAGTAALVGGIASRASAQKRVSVAPMPLRPGLGLAVSGAF